MAEMASIPGGDPQTLDSRLRGKDDCAEVLPRGSDMPPPARRMGPDADIL